MLAESHRVLVDASGFAALANEDDSNHRVARAIWDRLHWEHLAPFTTNFIVAETHALLLTRAGHSVARRWLRLVPVPETWVTEEDYARGRQIIEAHRDKSYSLTDAVSFAVMERLSTRLAFSFDEHFSQYGLHRLQPRGDESP
ncbi:MAG: type II toxin-antitoxin system VapC family toxin [Armatimonadetes bacterium]|nr:type II toxin-antitoxin system VapC family toxin [Armatimonadota bacterium]